MSPPGPVSSYLTFSPLPAEAFFGLRSFREAGSEGWASRSSADGYFLLHYNTLADIFPLGSMMLCADRTFLPDIPINTGTGRWNNLLPCKGRHSLIKDQNIS